MTHEITRLLDSIKDHPFFARYPIYFIGGTALSTYLDHRISYDVDFASREKLPVSAIRAFAFEIHATPVPDPTRASAFRINTGEELTHYHQKFMVEGVKMEFSYFNDPMIDVVLDQAQPEVCDGGSTLRKLDLEAVIRLKALALFKRQKSRDLFDMAIILERGLFPIDELERFYAFHSTGDQTLQEYIESFSPAGDDAGDSSLDFLPHHAHYKTFAKLPQDERFEIARGMLLDRINVRKRERLGQK